MEWDDELVLAFIHEYKIRNELWDTNHKYYRTVKKNRSAWAAISRKMNVEVTDLKKKMNNLLTSFRKMRRKLETIKQLGTETDFCNTSWFAYDALSFLQDRYQHKHTKIVLKHASTSTTEVSTDDNVECSKIKIKEITCLVEEPEAAMQYVTESVSNTQAEDDREMETCDFPKGEPIIKKHKLNQDSRIEEDYNILKSVSLSRTSLKHASTSTTEASTDDNVECSKIKIEEVTCSVEESEAAMQYVAESVSNTQAEDDRELETCDFPTREPMRKKHKLNQNSRVEEDYNFLKSFSNKEREKIDAYGEYIAGKLRLLDKRSCAFVQRDFGESLFKAELGEYKTSLQDKSSSRVSPCSLGLTLNPTLICALHQKMH